MEVRQAAKYPFMKEAARYLKEKGVSLESLISGIEYERARFRGKERVMEVLESNWIENRPLASQADATTELLSYPVARMIVSAVADPAFTTRYAIAESKKVNERLKEEQTTFVVKISEELGLRVSQENGSFEVDFADFLRFSSAMKSKDWKLVNQGLNHSRVRVSKHRLIRLIEQSLTEKILSELPLAVNDEILAAFGSDVEEIGRTLAEEMAARKTEDMGRLSIVNFPPCMRRLLGMMQAGENVPHSGRFALVTFLHTLGMDSQEILRAFATAPDFDESKSIYQIRHITGEISGTEYTPPECSTMKSYGICFDPDDLCKRDWMTHPLKYYRSKGRRLRSRG
ncbi:MAG TPA: DNA primase large subunit PriL [Thermoplasmata archaeon]